MTAAGGNKAVPASVRGPKASGNSMMLDSVQCRRIVFFDDGSCFRMAVFAGSYRAECRLRLPVDVGADCDSSEFCIGSIGSLVDALALLETVGCACVSNSINSPLPRIDRSSSRSPESATLTALAAMSLSDPVSEENNSA